MQHSVNLMLRLACLFAVATLCLAPRPAQAQEPMPRLESDAFAPSPSQQGGDAFLFGLSLFDPAPLMEELSRKILAAATCKPESNYNFVREQEPTLPKSRQGRPKERVLIFSGFYGASNTQFYCQTDDKRVSISSEAWGSKRITVPYEQDQEKRCLTATVYTDACGGSRTVRVCDEQQR